MKKNIIILCVIALFSVVGVLAISTNAGVVDLKDWVKVQIVSPLEANGGVPVNLQDQTTAPLDLYFLQEMGDRTNLTNDVEINDSVITVDDVSGFGVGSFIGIFSGVSGEGRFYFAEVLSITSDNLTLDTPLDFNFTDGDVVINTTRDLNVNGGTTTQIFIVSGAGPGSPLEIDITRVIFQITDNVAMDDGTFGGISALTDGIVLRRNNGQVNNIYNIKSNADFGLVAFDKDYADRAPAGTFGLTVRSTFAGQDKHGVAIRLAAGESLELLIQDDLSALSSFRILAQGHIVTDIL